MKIQSLQILRAFAAWAVVYHHYMQMFYDFQSENILGYLFSIRGSLGVDIFFVLSGFVMFMSASRTSVDGWSFFLKRLFRVVPAYWFFTFALVISGSFFVNEFKFTSYTIDTMVRSLFFVPHYNPSGLGVYPYLTVGWTLNYEILFYTTLSLCIFLSKRWAVVLCATLVLALPFLLKQSDSVILTVIKSQLMWQFVCGLLVAWLYSRFSLRGRVYEALGGVVLLVSLLMISGLLGYGFIQKTIAATLMVLGFLLLNNIFKECNRVVSLLVKLGDYSYSTYLSHVLVIGLFLNIFGNNLSFSEEVIILLGITLLICFVSAASYKFIENSKMILDIRNLLIRIKTTDNKKSGERATQLL